MPDARQLTAIKCLPDLIGVRHIGEFNENDLAAAHA